MTEYKRINSKLSSDEALQEGQEQSYFQNIETIPVRTCIVPLDEEILDARFYRNVLQMLSELTEHDTCIFVIDSPGGNADGMLALIDAVENCQGTVIADIRGEAHSAASVFALSCPNIQVGKRARMLCHSARFGLAPSKHADQRSHFQFNDKLLTSIIEEFYEGFLTSEEIQDVLNGKEHYLMAEEIEERLAAREKYFETKVEEESTPVPAPIVAKKDPKPKKVKTKALDAVPADQVAPDYYPL